MIGIIDTSTKMKPKVENIGEAAKEIEPLKLGQFIVLAMILSYFVAFCFGYMLAGEIKQEDCVAYTYNTAVRHSLQNYNISKIASELNIEITQYP